MKTLKLAVLLIALIFLNSCLDDDDPILPKGDYEKGYFIVNEGPFQNGSGTITFIDDEGIVSQNIYKTVNNEDIGNVVQSMTIVDDKAYIVVNNSHKIIVVNRYTMEKIAIIEGNNINNPRYFVAYGDTGYVSNWGDPFDPFDDFIALIDLKLNNVKNIIPVGEGPEEMLVENSKVFVNLQGGFGQNNQIVVIDTSSNLIDKSITVGDVPNSLIADNSGNIWVLCGGKPSWTGNESIGGLYKINTSNFDISSFEFGATEHPEHLTGEAGSLFYNLNGKIFAMDFKSSELPNESLNGFDGYYYTMKANNGELFVTDAGNFSSEGTLKIFNINSGALIETITTGIIPGNIVFQD